MTLSLVKSQNGETELQQTVNGKQFIWRKISNNKFEKLDNKNSALSYTKQNNSISYKTTDGVACTWSKK